MSISHKSIVSLIVVLVIAGGIFAYFQKRNNENKSQFTSKVERNLTQDEREFYENKLKQGQDRLNDLTHAKLTDAKDFFDAYQFIGSQYYGLGELEKSKQSYEKALSYTENNYNGWVSLYTVTFEQGDYDGAKQAILKAINLRADEPDLWKKYIVLTKEHFNAVPSELDGLYKEALEKTHNNPDMIAVYAQFLESIGKEDEAIKQWESAVALQPDNEQYTQELERLKKIK